VEDDQGRTLTPNLEVKMHECYPATRPYDNQKKSALRELKMKPG